MVKIKLDDFAKYWCTKCERIHHKFWQGKKTQIFPKHQKYGKKLTNVNLFKKDFIKKWNKEAERNKENSKEARNEARKAFINGGE